MLLEIGEQEIIVMWHKNISQHLLVAMWKVESILNDPGDPYKKSLMTQVSPATIFKF